MIGALRETITFLTPRREPDLGGGYEIVFEPHQTVPARVDAVAGTATPFIDRRLPVRRRRFTMRHREDIVFEMRVRHRGIVYRITDIQHDEQRRFQTVTGEEVRP